MDSILLTIRKMLGIETDFDGFDIDIIVGINSAFSVLNQLGVGPVDQFIVTNEEQTWSDFLGTTTNLESLKSYIYLKVRLLFDPPGNSFLVESYNRQIQELEWRFSVVVDTTV